MTTETEAKKKRTPKTAQAPAEPQVKPSKRTNITRESVVEKTSNIVELLRDMRDDALAAAEQTDEVVASVAIPALKAIDAALKDWASIIEHYNVHRTWRVGDIETVFSRLGVSHTNLTETLNAFLLETQPDRVAAAQERQQALAEELGVGDQPQTGGQGEGAEPGEDDDQVPKFLTEPRAA